jgi:hypothetical protein
MISSQKQRFFLACFSLISLFFLTSGKKESMIIDADYTLEEALKGTKAPKEIIDSIILINVSYIGFDGQKHKGQILVNKAIKDDVEYLFRELQKEKIAIKSVIPIVKYDWDDDKSMEANNTSGFNYRKVANKNTLSNHSWGRAIDVNPFTNPAIYSDGRVAPKGAIYNKKNIGTIHSSSPIVKKMKARGWEWGGDWTSLKDYQHFQKK